MLSSSDILKLRKGRLEDKENRKLEFEVRRFGLNTIGSAGVRKLKISTYLTRFRLSDTITNYFLWLFLSDFVLV